MEAQTAKTLLFVLLVLLRKGKRKTSRTKEQIQNILRNTRAKTSTDSVQRCFIVSQTSRRKLGLRRVLLILASLFTTSSDWVSPSSPTCLSPSHCRMCFKERSPGAETKKPFHFLLFQFLVPDVYFQPFLSHTMCTRTIRNEMHTLCNQSDLREQILKRKQQFYSGSF